jgi:hypothetical protein
MFLVYNQNSTGENMKPLVEKVIQLETSTQEIMRQFDDFKHYLSKNFPEVLLDKPHKIPATDCNRIKNLHIKNYSSGK